MDEQTDALQPQDEETQTGSGTAEAEDQPLREEDVSAGDGLNDDVREGDEGDLPGDSA